MNTFTLTFKMDADGYQNTVHGYNLCDSCAAALFSGNVNGQCLIEDVEHISFTSESNATECDGCCN